MQNKPKSYDFSVIDVSSCHTACFMLTFSKDIAEHVGRHWGMKLQIMGEVSYMSLQWHLHHMSSSVYEGVSFS